MADEEGWVDVAAFADLDAKRMKGVYPKGVPLLLVRLANEVFALSNRCPHLGCPLSTGRLEGESVICPCHDWSFDIRSGGLVMSPEISLRKYPVRISGNRILVKLED